MTSLKSQIHDRLIEAGFEQDQATGVYRNPDGFTADGETGEITPATPGGAELEAEPGSNSGIVAADQLRLFIERVERLEEEKKAIADDQKDVYAEAKSQGYDVKIMRKIVALRKLETHQRQEQDALMETYRSALGML